MKFNVPLCASIAALGLIGSALAEDKSPAVTTNPARAGDGVEIGIARRDGVTVTGGEAFVTRNGTTEKLSKDLLLPSGITVRPDGTVLAADNSKIPLRATQILTFDGQIMNLPPDPNVNPGDPRSGAVEGRSNIGVSGTTGTSVSTTTGANGMPPGSSRSPLPDRPNGGGSVFLSPDGTPVLGTPNADGTITTSTGQVLPGTGLRPVTFGQDGTPALGTLNSNGTVTRADGSVVYPDGSVRTGAGTLVSPATNSGTQQVPIGRGSGDQQTNAASPQYGSAGGAANSPNNTGTINNGQPGTGGGTINNGNGNPGAPSVGGGTTQTNNGVTTGRTGTSGSAVNSSGGTTRGTNGASGGAAAGGGATGAGGASGGAAGGASR